MQESPVYREFCRNIVHDIGNIKRANCGMLDKTIHEEDVSLNCGLSFPGSEVDFSFTLTKHWLGSCNRDLWLRVRLLNASRSHSFWLYYNSIK